MKIIRYTTLLIVIFFSSCLNSQNINNITLFEYNNIKINNIYIADIDKTKGDLNQMKNLFGFSFILNSSNEYLIVKELENHNKGIYFYFEDNQLYEYKISNNQSNLNIKGVNITVGDNIDKLGNVTINNSNEIKFSTVETSDILTIRFNRSNNLITQIQYLTLD